MLIAVPLIPDSHLFLEKIMSEVTFIFQTYDDGSCILSFDPTTVSPKKGLAKLKKKVPVKMRLLAPAGSTDIIEKATLTFDKMENEGWPFADQDASVIVWKKGQHNLETTSTKGKWKFGAVLRSKEGLQYTLPDPELQVGDGPSDDGPP
jgi:hypothetical protein